MCAPWEVWNAQGNEISYRCLVLLFCGPVHDQKESASQTRAKEQRHGGLILLFLLLSEVQNQLLLPTDRMHLPQVKVWACPGWGVGSRSEQKGPGRLLTDISGLLELTIAMKWLTPIATDCTCGNSCVHRFLNCFVLNCLLQMPKVPASYNVDHERRFHQVWLGKRKNVGWELPMSLPKWAKLWWDTHEDEHPSGAISTFVKMWN